MTQTRVLTGAGIGLALTVLALAIYYLMSHFGHGAQSAVDPQHVVHGLIARGVDPSTVPMNAR